MDNRNINASRLISNTMGIALIIAVFQSLANYALFNESTNLTSMLIMLSFLPLILKSIFSGFRMVQDSLYPQVEVTEVEEEGDTSTNGSVLSYFGTFFSRKPVKQLEGLNNAPALK